ncbi:histidine phosphatase family protein [Nocardia sp. NBC_01503]|uniref:histidine phosphatase family protein n=1 Tax=Nocardia sp. NBC_01503 TaxID=2975997 RepID=UPI002E7BA238|nr:histidine phosphatase family protein [Nocardia sp. NBC_01503]WTL30876.1 histidine phosphatase family protein [Nocardia sp. NBC_01503]
MSAVTRLTLITHAITDAVQGARFPVDEPINALGERTIAKVGALMGADHTVIRYAPEMRTRATASALGLAGEPDAALRDIDHGRWAGQGMDTLASEDLMAWLTDPAYRGHGGESVTDLIDRVRGWLGELAGRGEHITAITHPAIVRAAVVCTLDAPAQSFWRIDIPPLTATTLHHRVPAWTLRTTASALY